MLRSLLLISLLRAGAAMCVKPLQHPPQALLDNWVSGCDTFLLPPDNQYPRVILPAWPPYLEAPPVGTLVCVRGSRGCGVSRVAGLTEGGDLEVVPTSGPRAGVPTTTTRRKAECMRGRDAARPAVLLCSETESFRRLARSQVLASDVVLEIGCSYGMATRELAARACSVIAVDVNADSLERAAEHCAHHGNVRFEMLDATRELPRLVSVAREAGVSVIFVDINGNRASQAVSALLHGLQERLSPAVTVVKNRELYVAAGAHARAYAGSGGGGDEGSGGEKEASGNDEDVSAGAGLLPKGAHFWQAALLQAALPDGAAARPRERPREATPAADSAAHCAMVASWRATVGTHTGAPTLFSAESRLGGGMRVVVRERAGGWRTLHQVGAEREIMLGVTRVDGRGQLMPRAVPSEYLKTMAALGLAALERRRAPGEWNEERTEPSAELKKEPLAAPHSGEGGAGFSRAPPSRPPPLPPPRLLFLGLGAGTLPKLISHLLPEAELLGVECDDAVLDAAVAWLGLDEGAVGIARGDALRWVEERAAEQARGGAEGARDDGRLFDAVFVDIFDECNLCPPGFCSEAFLTSLRSIVAEGGLVVHNLHAGSKALEAELRSAEETYARVFGGRHCCRLASLDSKPWAGNAIIGASRPRERAGAGAEESLFEPAALAEAADATQRRLGVDFDLAARCRHGACAIGVAEVA